MFITRRQFTAMVGSVASLALTSACNRVSELQPAADGRLTTRPRRDVKTSTGGERALGLDSARDAILHLPPTMSTTAVPLLVFLHGAGQSGQDMLEYLGPAPDEAGVAVLAPNSRGPTWDAIRGRFGRDVAFLNRALERVFDLVAVDPARLAIGGFSDGASYALALGLINGDLFPRVLACSPGFVIEGPPNGHPRFFISHGTGDRILPIDRCSREIVPGLRRRGYDVTFQEFDGGHYVPEPIARAGMQWVAAEN